MDSYSPEPGEIVEDDIPFIKRSNHKRKRSTDKKIKKKEKRKHYKSRAKYSKSKSESESECSITIKGSPKQKIQEQTQQERVIQEDEQLESVFIEFGVTKSVSNDQLEERRKRIEAIRMKHQINAIQKSPGTNEDCLSLENNSQSITQDHNNNNNNAFITNKEQQESFLKYIDLERDLLIKEEQGSCSLYNNHIEMNAKDTTNNQSPLTPDMFGDDPIEEKQHRNKKNNTQTINLSFYNQKESIGYYIPQLNEIIYSKYKVIGLCGKGVFSSVVKVLDFFNNIEYALKIIRNIDIMKNSGDKERAIISLLNKEDLEDKAHIIRLKDSFEFNNHLCMIIDLYQMNLRDLLKASESKGILMNQVKSFSKQLIMGFILIHKNRLIHADFKPDNTVIDRSGNNIRICDFGSAFFEDEAIITSELVSRYYRAPEIILGMKPNQKIDIWSLGCTLFELYTGTILFPGKSNNEMIRLFIEVKGKFSKKLMKRCTYWDDYFSNDGNYFKSKEYDTKINSEYTKEIDLNQLKQKDILTLLKESDHGKRETDAKSLNNFANFLDNCFVFDPFKRLSAIDAFTHPFLIIN